jgi:putative transposase
MPRQPRIDLGNEIYHVINRANGRLTIFHSAKDYRAFEELLKEAKEWFNMRILGYVIMPNHWHLILHPRNDGDVARFMHWLSTTHTRRYHVETKTVGRGHLYQGRYKSFVVEDGNYLLTLVKYVERNPVRAKLSNYCEAWQWGSAWRRVNGTPKQKLLLDPSPEPFPRGYRQWINATEEEDSLTVIRTSVNRGVPYGSVEWIDAMKERIKDSTHQ